MLRAFRLPAATRDRYTLLEALPRMRGSRAFDAYVRVCESGEPWVKEVTYDTPFGDGYMLGTFVQRTAKLGDGLVELPHRRDRAAADGGRAAQLRRRRGARPERAGRGDRDARRRCSSGAPEEPPSPEVLRQLRASAERARELIDGVLVYARAGELTSRAGRARRADGRGRPRTCARGLEEAGATLEVGELPEVEGDPRQLRRVLQNLLATR